MEPIELTWPGSSDKVTITRMTNRANDAYAAVAKTIHSRYPYFWPTYRDAAGQEHSVDQLLSWMAEVGRVYDQEGPILIARHTTSGNNVIAAAMACPTEDGKKATLVIQTLGGYAADTIDVAMWDALAEQCSLKGWKLDPVTRPAV